jgi:hypothetical protein
MYLKRTLVLLTVLAALFVLPWPPVPAYAQDYSFSLDREVVDVWINQDGSVRLEYWFTFTCDPGAHAIDVVDLGLPTGDYNISDIRGDVDGMSARVDTDYQGGGDYGVAVWLDGGTIQPGQSGTVHVVVDRVGRMVYPDSDDDAYASTQFSPVWFGSEFVHGTTDMAVSFHLPAGVQPEEPRWHGSPSGWPQEQPDTALDAEGRVLYTWTSPAAEPDRQYLFGASFPRQYVDESAIQTGPSGLEQFFAGIGSALSCLTGIICNPFVIFIAIFAAIAVLGSRAQRRRRMQYLPPSMKVEGVGIKRGLTAVEAAILLETPLDRILTMILFGLLKKEAVTVLEDKPLRIEVGKPVPEDLRPYEKSFVEAVTSDGTLDEKELRKLMVALVKEVNNKMKGFSRRESVAYYQDIVRRAWQQVEGAETPEVRSQYFDEGLQWAMLDDDFGQRVERSFRTGPVFLPMWWGYYRPWAHVAASPTPAAGTPSRAAPSSAGRSVQLPTLPGAAFAATIVRGVESTAGGIVRNVTGFTSGVTQVTNPPPKTSRSGGSIGRGGSGCACACACACAGCACACAGGGR